MEITLNKSLAYINSFEISDDLEDQTATLEQVDEDEQGLFNDPLYSNTFKYNYAE